MTQPATPRLQLQTLFVIDARRRIVHTREPNPSPGPAFVFIRGRSSCAWAAHADLPETVALELERFASDESPLANWETPLRHTDRYTSLTGGRFQSGPAFEFPNQLVDHGGTRVITDEAGLNHHFSGWVVGEIEAGRSPVVAVCLDGHAVSVCFCARRSAVAAEAGIETAPSFRGRGFAPRVAIAWANHVRSLGLTPIYSTDWSNTASLAVARKLGLIPFAAVFGIDV